MAGKVGRPVGITKDKRMFGYKYNEKEYNEMKKALEKYKENIIVQHVKGTIYSDYRK